MTKECVTVTGIMQTYRLVDRLLPMLYKGTPDTESIVGIM